MSQLPSRNPNDDRHLLLEIVESGWTEELASSLDIAFADDIRRLIVLNMWRAGLSPYRFDPSSASRVLQDRNLEVFENSLSDIWQSLMSGLLIEYVRKQNASPDPLPFLQYVGGVVRNVVINNARSLRLIPRRSATLILKDCCEGKREQTKVRALARAKFRLTTRAESEILANAGSEFHPVYSNLPHLVDYFFEQYLPSKCSEISRRRGRGALEKLIREFLQTEYKKGFGYIGQIVAWDSESRVRVQGCNDSEEDEFLSQLFAQGADRL